MEKRGVAVVQLAARLFKRGRLVALCLENGDIAAAYAILLETDLAVARHVALLCVGRSRTALDDNCLE